MTCKREVVRRRKDCIHNFSSAVVKIGGIVKYVPPLHLSHRTSHLLTLFVNKAGTFGDHPTCNANRHLQMRYHKDAVSNKLAFYNLSKRQTDVWKLIQKAALSKEVSVAGTNQFVIKSFFYIYMTVDKEKLGSFTQF